MRQLNINRGGLHARCDRTRARVLCVLLSLFCHFWARPRAAARYPAQQTARAHVE
jgi:hypothetical protein